MLICGTRPEAIKMAPLINRLRTSDSISLSVCSTGQHREMLQQVFELFEIQPDFDLSLMKPEQSLSEVTAGILTNLSDLLKKEKPDRVLVHGDTNTTMSATMAAFYNQIPVAHVEAGLRTGNNYSPWPEEVNRRITSVIADRHYAPTQQSKLNLLAENVAESSIVVTGNTVVDALLATAARFESDPSLEATIAKDLPTFDPDKKMILVTGHRRENVGEGIDNMCEALRSIADRGDTQVIWPLHLNPKVRGPIEAQLGSHPAITLIEPVQYLHFVYLMKNSHIIVTDSGGVQEEAPSLGVPVLVTRDTTERPEAVDAGTVLLIGSDSSVIVNKLNMLLNDPDLYQKISIATNPYGDGTASEKIMKDLEENG